MIMPAKNVEKTVEAAVRSVLEEPEVLELIVVEDGSEDETPLILDKIRAEDSRLVIIAGGNLGVTGGINRGLEFARGAYFARCDADDAWKGARLRWQIPFLEDNPDYVAVSGGFSTITDTGRHIVDLACDGEPFEQTDKLRRGETTSHLCTMLIRMETVRKLGGVRSWFINGQDLDLQARVAGCGRVWHEPRSILSYRLHDASVTHSIGAKRRKFFEDATKRFAHQRLANGEDDIMRGTPPNIPTEIQNAQDNTSAAEHVANQLTGEGWRRFEAGQTRRALGLLLRALWQQPTWPPRWRNLAVMLAKTVLPR